MIVRDDRDKPCPCCGRVPVRGSTWDRLIAQDELLGLLRAHLESRSIGALARRALGIATVIAGRVARGRDIDPVQIGALVRLLQRAVDDDAAVVRRWPP